MLIFRATSLKYCYLHVLNFYLDNGVMTTPKRRILSFVFTVVTIEHFLTCGLCKTSVFHPWLLVYAANR